MQTRSRFGPVTYDIVDLISNLKSVFQRLRATALNDFKIHGKKQSGGEKYDISIKDDDPLPSYTTIEFTAEGSVAIAEVASAQVRRERHNLDIEIESNSHELILTIKTESSACDINYLREVAEIIATNLKFSKRKNYVLCLSGGGLRALFFQIGILSYLNRSKILKDVTSIYSVSGGSILAGHLLMNWENYIGERGQFQEAANSLINKISTLDIRGRIIRKDAIWLGTVVATAFLLPSVISLIYPYTWVLIASIVLFFIISATFGIWVYNHLRSNRISRLRGIYNEIFNNISLVNAYSRQTPSEEQDETNILSRRPDPNFLTTGIQTGCMAAFSIKREKPQRFNTKSTHPISPQLRIWKETSDNKHAPESFDLSHDFQLADAIAASSAYPPLFPPIDLKTDCGEEFHDVNNAKLKFLDTYLSDGGVFDNLGLRSFTIAQENFPEDVDFVITCDAGNPLSFQDRPKGFAFLALRTIEILMNRIAILEKINANIHGKVINFSIASKYPSTFPVSESSQHQIAEIRTDLDKFTPNEVIALVMHGFKVAQNTAQTHHLVHTEEITETFDPWIPDYCKSVGLPNDDTRKKVENSLDSARSVKLGIFSFKTPTPALLCSVAGLSPIAACILLFFSGRNGAAKMDIDILEQREAQAREAGSREKETSKNQEIGGLKKEISKLEEIDKKTKEDFERANKDLETKDRTIQTLTEINIGSTHEKKELLTQISNLKSNLFQHEQFTSVELMQMLNRISKKRSEGGGSSLSTLEIGANSKTSFNVIQQRYSSSNGEKKERLYMWFTTSNTDPKLFFVGSDNSTGNTEISGMINLNLLMKDLNLPTVRNNLPDGWFNIRLNLTGSAHVFRLEDKDQENNIRLDVGQPK